jgi:hypothetical protein
MRKPLPKLAIHRETLRALNELQLTRAVGGVDSGAGTGCPNVNVQVAVDQKPPGG